MQPLARTNIAMHHNVSTVEICHDKVAIGDDLIMRQVVQDDKHSLDLRRPRFLSTPIKYTHERSSGYLSHHPIWHGN